MKKMNIGRMLGWIIVLTIISVAIMFSGCSQSQRDWCDRGREGVDNIAHNTEQRYEQLFKACDDKLLRQIDAAFEDVTLVRNGALFDKEGKQIEMSNKWLAEEKDGLKVAFALWRSERSKLQQQFTDEMANIALTREAFDKIESLNNAWSSTAEVMGAKLDKMIAKIDELEKLQAAAETSAD